MAALVLVLIFLAMTGHSSANWCVCREGSSDQMLQKAIDYACGNGADCNPIHQNGACYNPNTVRAHCSYAVNSYYQRKSQSGATCDFTGCAAISSSDPSITGCVYPSSFSSAGTGTTPVTTTPSGNTPGSVSPYTTTPSGNGLYGGVGTGLGPSGLNDNISHGVAKTTNCGLFSFCVLVVVGMVLL